eukprot:7380417-Prymnesium_polylepis.2
MEGHKSPQVRRATRSPGRWPVAVSVARWLPMVEVLLFLSVSAHPRLDRARHRPQQPRERYWLVWPARPLCVVLYQRVVERHCEATADAASVRLAAHKRLVVQPNTQQLPVGWHGLDYKALREELQQRGKAQASLLAGRSQVWQKLHECVQADRWAIVGKDGLLNERGCEPLGGRECATRMRACEGRSARRQQRLLRGEGQASCREAAQHLAVERMSLDKCS